MKVKEEEQKGMEEYKKEFARTEEQLRGELVECNKLIGQFSGHQYFFPTLS